MRSLSRQRRRQAELETRRARTETRGGIETGPFGSVLTSATLAERAVVFLVNPSKQIRRSTLELDGVKLKPARVSWANEDQLRFVLREGRKR